MNTKMTITVLRKEITLTLDEARAYHNALNEIFSEKKLMSDIPVPQYFYRTVPITMANAPWDHFPMWRDTHIIPHGQVLCGVTPGSKSDAGL